MVDHGRSPLSQGVSRCQERKNYCENISSVLKFDKTKVYSIKVKLEHYFSCYSKVAKNKSDI